MRIIAKFPCVGLMALALFCACAGIARAQEAAETTNAPAATALSGATNAPAAPPATPAPSVHLEDVVSMGHDAVLQADEEAKDVVVIFGSARILGHATGDVVTIGGDVDLQGRVDGDVVSVFGGIKSGSNAVAGHDVVTVGGTLDRAPGSKIHGRVQQTAIDIPGFGNFNWLSKWVQRCLFEFRPLSFGVGWVWAVAGAFFAVYLLIAAAFPGAVRACVVALNERPVTTLAVGLLGKLGLAIVYLLLIITLIGIAFIPFLQVAVIVAFLVGKVAILEYLGSGIGKATGVGFLQRPMPAFVLGAAIITLIYTIPVLGFVTYFFVTAWGFGAAATAAYLSMRRERPPTAPIAPSTPPPTAPPSDFGIPAAGVAGAAAGGVASAFVTSGAPGFADPAAPAAQSVSTPPSLTPQAPAPPAALAFPRAGFWERMGAGFLDCVLVAVVSAYGGPGLFFLVAIAYFVAMWTWRGTTVGGIILRLQVVRLDGRPTTFPVALVRALAAMFSILVFFLGFFWIGWDNGKQGWHDKLAGTAVVRLPHAPALVCV